MFRGVREYLEGHGDLVSRLRRGITRVTKEVTGIISRLTSPLDQFRWNPKGVQIWR